MSDKQVDTRERYLAGWDARLNPHDAQDKQEEADEHRIGSGIALGTACGVAIGASLGVALDNLAVGVSLGAALGVAVGSIFASKLRR